MVMAVRHEYCLDLSEFAPSDGAFNASELQLRAAMPSDMPALAELMIDAYRGTIDYDGETIEDAIGEVNAYLSGQRGGAPLLRESQLAFEEGILVSACLVADWHERQQPVIAYVMTRARSKNKGLARRVLVSTLQKLQGEGHAGVGAVITEGNSASEMLFFRLGFQKVSA